MSQTCVLLYANFSKPRLTQSLSQIMNFQSFVTVERYIKQNMTLLTISSSQPSTRNSNLFTRQYDASLEYIVDN